MPFLMIAFFVILIAIVLLLPAKEKSRVSAETWGNTPATDTLTTNEDVMAQTPAMPPGNGRIDQNNAVIKIEQSRTIILANELVLEPFVYTFRFKR